jgi:hypothetical protein
VYHDVISFPVKQMSFANVKDIALCLKRIKIKKVLDLISYNDVKRGKTFNAMSQGQMMFL